MKMTSLVKMWKDLRGWTWSTDLGSTCRDWAIVQQGNGDVRAGRMGRGHGLRRR